VALFHPVVEGWFRARYGEATAVQRAAWPEVLGGRSVLLTAPTGSGKTLAAFLACLDGLVRRAVVGDLPDATQVLYVTPLKALSTDVRNNLEAPLRELLDVALAQGTLMAPVRAAVRTGDTPAAERRAQLKRPPHVLVTTPESLFILLASASGQRMLSTVKTVIVDELHALLADKRGAHLALSLEQLETVAGASGGLQRIGLSATMRPLELAARYLVGSTRPLPTLVDVGQRRALDLAIELPVGRAEGDELGPVCTNEQWEAIYDRLAALATAHRSTLVFVNTRRLVERVAHRLSARLGEDAVGAHHGSLARARRQQTERDLKAGALRVVVATASLELGIDVGAVELVCLVGSSRSISTALQRVGRSGHALGALPKGRFFPLTRDQLVECTAVVRSIRHAFAHPADEPLLERLELRQAPLDILAQQVAAACLGAEEGRFEAELLAQVRAAAPYGDLAVEAFEGVVELLANGVATRRGRVGALLHRDGVHRRLRARRGARLTVLTSGGAIPDTASYDVIESHGDEGGQFLGTVDEDFAVDSMAGDIFLLGNRPWRILRVEAGRMRVEDAGDQSPSVPFWFGEAPARSRELSSEIAALRHAAVRGDLDEESTGLDGRGQRLLERYVAAGVAALGAVPSHDTVIAERFFDEGGGMQLVLHAPFGGRINRAWGLALRKNFCRSFDFELQAAATDDGILLSLGAQHSFPLETIFALVHPDQLRDTLTQAVLQAPMFRTRWRWNATRALALTRMRGGKRVPPLLLRMRSEDLLGAVFPAQLGCQDNHGAAPIEVPAHPLVLETLHDCLHEAMDLDGLREVLRGLRSGAIRTLAVDTPEPSVFAHEILNANPYAFVDDAPLEERRSRAVAVRRGLGGAVAERLGGLDPEVVRSIVDQAQPGVRDAEELHDLLLTVVALPTAPSAPPWLSPAGAAAWRRWWAALAGAGRATELATEQGAVWVATERRGLAAALYGGGGPGIAGEGGKEVAALSDVGGASGGVGDGEQRERALVELLRGHLAYWGPTTASELSRALQLPRPEVELGLAQLENDGLVLRGRFFSVSGAGAAGAPAEVQWCDRLLLARIHRRMVHDLRRAIQPASIGEFQRFLLAWQHVAPSSRLTGRLGLEQLVEQLQGFEAPAALWESQLLGARMQGYDPAWLDQLCLGGKVAWGRLSLREGGGATPSRGALVTLALRGELPWLLSPRNDADLAAGEATLSHAARDVLAYLRAAGASFAEDLFAGAGRLRSEVDDALGELVAAGWITGDGFAQLRQLLGGRARRARRRRPVALSTLLARGFGLGAATATGAGEGSGLVVGRWALLRAGVAPSDEERLEGWARQYLRRYGVVCRELLARETQPPPWRRLREVYRRWEMRGELRAGRLVRGLSGEQFALPEALEALRALRERPPSGERVRLSACDPLNLAGVLEPGPRAPAVPGRYVVYVDGVLEVEGRRVAENGPPVVATRGTVGR
jgi:ATP-dependent Lhr-like helicase